MASLSAFRHVVGGKHYIVGNHVWASNRCVKIEFDSDYYIVSKQINGKNWLKRAAKIIDSIPNPVTVDWFREHGWFVDPEMRVQDGE